MTSEFFGPLPPSDFNQDAMVRWLDQQVVSFQKIITGSLQANNVLSSSNYVAGVSGWMIDGDGNAEFNDVEVRGDIVSGNWDGADPVDLSSVTGSDANATLGFALDSSKGSAHFAGPVFFGKKEANGLNGLNTGVGSTSSTIRWLRGGDVVGDMYATGNNENDNPRLIIRGPDDASSIISLQKAGGAILANVSLGFHVEIDGRLFLVQGGSAAAPALTFSSDTDTGIYRSNADQIGFATGGSRRFYMSTAYLTGDGNTGGPAISSAPGSASAPVYSFFNDGDTGMYLSGSNELSFATAGSQRVAITNAGHLSLNGALIIQDGSAASPGIRFSSDSNTGIYRAGADIVAFTTGGVLRGSFQANGFYATTPNTTGSAANLVTAGSGHNNFMRSTSARRYKTEITYDPEQLLAVELRPAKFYRADDDAWYYGFIADDLAEEDPLLGTFDPDTGEIENYDSRAVMAVMAAKINRLEDKVAKLEAKCLA